MPSEPIIVLGWRMTVRTSSSFMLWRTAVTPGGVRDHVIGGGLRLLAELARQLGDGLALPLRVTGRRGDRDAVGRHSAEAARPAVERAVARHGLEHRAARGV